MIQHKVDAKKSALAAPADPAVPGPSGSGGGGEDKAGKSPVKVEPGEDAKSEDKGAEPVKDEVTLAEFLQTVVPEDIRMDELQAGPYANVEDPFANFGILIWAYLYLKLRRNRQRSFTVRTNCHGWSSSVSPFSTLCWRWSITSRKFA